MRAMTIMGDSTNSMAEPVTQMRDQSLWLHVSPIRDQEMYDSNLYVSSSWDEAFLFAPSVTEGFCSQAGGRESTDGANQQLAHQAVQASHEQIQQRSDVFALYTRCSPFINALTAVETASSAAQSPNLSGEHARRADRSCSHENCRARRRNPC